MRAAAAVADRHQLFRLRFQGAAVARARGVLRAIALGRHAARGAEEVAGGVEVEGVRCPDLILEAAVMLPRAGACRFTHQVVLLAGGGLSLAAVGIDDKGKIDRQRIAEVLLAGGDGGDSRVLTRESTVVACCTFWMSV